MWGKSIMSLGKTLVHEDLSDGSKTQRMELGKRVKELRKQRRLSQEELSLRSRLHRNYISDIERGRRNISFDALFRLASGLEMQIRDLF